ncbi:MAG: UvrD-helicase domain-containing protein [Bacteroidales bacterium]|nr:UvrD-helicase domain-containing protein [Bacteroidales bacterium]
MSKELLIYNASAGSGKTHNLSEQFAKYLLEGGPEAYKHQMAVTFTNKATLEMKERIIKTLYEKSIGKNGEDKKVQEKAKGVLRRLVHDYTMFRVSTIDSFFQRVLRAFALEMGHRGAFDTSLDDDLAVSEALDSLYSKLGKPECEELLERIKNLSLSRIEDDKNWDWKRDLLRISSEITKSGYRSRKKEAEEKARQNGEKLKSYEEFNKELNYKREVLRKDFIEPLEALNEELIRASELLKDDFVKSKTTSKFFGTITGKFRFIDPLSKKVAPFKDSFDVEKWKDDPQSFFFKNTPDSIINSYKDSVGVILSKIEALYADQYENYVSYQLVSRNIRETTLLDYISAELEEYLKQQQLTLLADAPQILSDLIGGSDTPFVYEKIGTTLNHYLLDEFQDTSDSQWENFRPLLLNSLAEGNSSLLVGDVKQSIYRWRGGDWNILRSEIPDKFKEFCFTKPLLVNYRSLSNIVAFNNLLFSEPGCLVSAFSGLLGEKVSEKSKFAMPEVVRGIYAGSAQEVCDKYKSVGQKGVVKVIYAGKSSRYIKDYITTPADFACVDVVRRIWELTGCGGEGSAVAGSAVAGSGGAGSGVAVEGCGVAGETVAYGGEVADRVAYGGGGGAKYSLSDIAILVSSNKEAEKIAGVLVKKGISITTTDSLNIGSNNTVAVILELLRKLVEPESERLEALARISGAKVKNLGLLERDGVAAVAGSGVASGGCEVGGVASEVSGAQDGIADGIADGAAAVAYGSGSTVGGTEAVAEAEEFRRRLAECGTLYEICKVLINTFIESYPVGDASFVKAFLDKVLDYNTTNGTNISMFLRWWEENQKNFYIPELSGKTDAVRVMTMHKAKGLAFKVVFTPFLRDEVLKLKGDRWLISDSEWLDFKAPLMINVEGLGVRDSIYRADYDNELLQTCIDNINLAYVSFTRAKERLYIYARGYNKGTLSAELNNICKGCVGAEGKDGEGEVLKVHFKREDKVLTISELRKIYDNADPDDERDPFTYTEYTFGDESEDPLKEKDEKETLYSLQESDGTLLTETLSNESQKKSLRSRYDNDDNIRRGILMHEIFSYIGEVSQQSDIKRVVEGATEKFLKNNPSSLLGNDRDKIVDTIMNLIPAALPYGWFTDKYSVETESEYLDGDMICRPDRVMFSKNGDETVIVDYKFGTLSSSDDNEGEGGSLKKYVNQVKRYKNLFSRMGKGTVKGYLWYVFEKKIVDV